MSKKPSKETKILQLSFDMSDDKQKNCYELISLISRKKSRFISNLVDEFLKNHPNAKEKKTLSFFVEHYDELKNLANTTGMPTLVIQETAAAYRDHSNEIAQEDNNKQNETAAMGAFTV